MRELLAVRAAIDQITPEEFHLQNDRFRLNLAPGYKLLFLVANNDWVRATRESVNFRRPDTVETVLTLDVDFDRITHEAFRDDAREILLPIVVLPPQTFAVYSSAEHTVTDTSGKVVPTLPDSDVRQLISCAFADLLANKIAPHLLRSRDSRPFRLDEDQKVLLSAALYRLLRHENIEPHDLNDSGYRLGRLERSRLGLHMLLGQLLHMLRADDPPGMHDEEAANNIGWLGVQLARVLRAFAESAVVVVAVERNMRRTTFAVRAPSRGLLPESDTQKLSRPSTWRWIRTGTGTRLSWHVDLRLDLLLPSADADRQVEVNLPDGAPLDLSRSSRPCAEIEIEAKPPPQANQLNVLMRELIELSRRDNWPLPLAMCLADLAELKARAVLDCLSYYENGTIWSEAGRAALHEVGARFRKLVAALRQLADDGASASREKAWTDLIPVWDGGRWLPTRLERRISTSTFSPRAAVLRVERIEDVSIRPAPIRTRVHVRIAARDRGYFSAPNMSTSRPDHARLEILGTSWWRNVTAETLLLSQASYGYLVWQHRAATTLRDVLANARSPRPLSVPRSLPASGRRSEGGKWSRLLDRLSDEEALDKSGEDLGSSTAMKLTARGSSRSDDVVEAGAASRDNPAGLLALMRSGTAGQSLNFVVFREEPTADWISKDNVFPVDLEPDRPIMVDDVGDAVEIFMGFRSDPLAMTDHPVCFLSYAARSLHLHVREIQFPAPGPPVMYRDYRWARILISLGGPAIGRLGPLLRLVSDHTRRFSECIVGIRTTSDSRLRLINIKLADMPLASDRPVEHLVVASQIDPIATSRSQPGEASDDRAWHVLAICADPYRGIDYEIFRSLGVFRLAGLSYSLVHGKAVAMLLGHGAVKEPRLEEIFTVDRARLAEANAAVLVDAWQSQAELGTAGPDPLLRVCIRLPDWGGAMLSAVEALREVLLPQGAPLHMEPSHWCASANSADGGHLIWLTLRLPLNTNQAAGLNHAYLGEAEKRIRMLTARKMATEAGIPSAGLGALTNISVKLTLITAPGYDLPINLAEQPIQAANDP